MKSWQPHLGGFESICPVCGNTFIGRKNKVYCDGICKARHNNDLAAERNTETKQHLGASINNIRILTKIMDEAMLPVHNTDMIHLEKLGFDSLAPKTRLTYNGEPWFGIGNFLYQKHDDGQVEIMYKNWKDEYDSN